MKRIEIEILSDSINCPVVSVPGRKYPGVVIQGDSLKILLGLAEEIGNQTTSDQDEELAATLERLKRKLSDYVTEYETAMKAHGRDLPYFKP
jgi:hypothetical protein